VRVIFPLRSSVNRAGSDPASRPETRVLCINIQLFALHHSSSHHHKSSASNQAFNNQHSTHPHLFSLQQPTFKMTGRTSYLILHPPHLSTRSLTDIFFYRRQGWQGSRKGWCQAPQEDFARQHPGYHQARYPPSRSSWWCQAYLSHDLRGDSWCSQDLPRGCHS